MGLNLTIGLPEAAGPGYSTGQGNTSKQVQVCIGPPPARELRLENPLEPSLNRLRVEAPSAATLEPYSRALLRETLVPKVDELAKERVRLILRSNETVLSGRERARLDYLNWQIEQAEEAEYGDSWDAIASVINRQAGLAREIQTFVDDLRRETPSAFNSRKR